MRAAATKSGGVLLAILGNNTLTSGYNTRLQKDYGARRILGKRRTMEIKNRLYRGAVGRMIP